MKNRIVFKLDPTFKSKIQGSNIEINSIKSVFQTLQTQEISLKFPKAHLPEGKNQVDLSTWFEVVYNANIDPIEASAMLIKTKCVLFAEPHYVYKPFYDPSDPDTVQQYWINLAKAREGWDIQKGDTNVVIGIIDTGIEWNHPDLIGNIKLNISDPLNGIDDDGDGYTDNFHGWDLAGQFASTLIGDNQPNSDSTYLHHGTGVTGYASATTDNAIGVAGAGFNCKFLPIKASAEVNPSGVQLVMGYEGIVYAADHGCAIINCSWGGNQFSFLGQDIINYATYNRNALVIAACGNSNNSTKVYPAAYDNVISVGATNALDQKGAVSTFGTWVDLMAPGSSQTTAFPSTYYFSGVQYTSYASPLAAGLAALIKSNFPSYTSEQVGQQLRVTCDKIDALNVPYTDLLGSGRINFFNALASNSPAIRNQLVTLTDNNNNIPESGESINFIGTFKNFLSPTANLNVTISCADPNINITTATRNLGGISTLQVKTTQANPFVFIVNPSTPANYSVDFKITYSDGPYNDFEYFTVIINPSFQTLANNYIQLSLTNKGNFGFNNYPSNNQGIGFLYKGEQMIYEGGFLVGQNSSKVSNNIRKNGTSQNTDFVSVNNLNISNPGQTADHEANTSFNDLGADTLKLNIEVKQNNYLFENDKFVINKYTILNKNLFVMDSIYSGMFADWDIANAAFNKAAYDSSNKLVYAYSTEPLEKQHIGLVLLSNDSINAYCRDITQSFLFNSSNKFKALSSKLDSTVAGQGVNGSDIYQFMSAGPYKIYPGDSHVVYFAIVAGDSLADLKANAVKARSRYNCVFVGNNFAVNLGPDQSSCDPITLDATTSGGTSYLWSNNSTSPQIQVIASGTYSVVVTDTNGCVDEDFISITINSSLSPSYLISDDSVFVGDTVYFNDNTNGALSWDWNFGDGFGSLNRVTTHIFDNSGTFPIVLIISNGTCQDTIYDSIFVAPKTSLLSNSLTNFNLYPNPAQNHLILETELENFKIELFNLTGQLVWESKTYSKAKTHFIELPNLQNGSYLIKIGDFAKPLYILK